MKNKDHEVIIIGGSFSGLSAALTLGRMLLNRIGYIRNLKIAICIKDFNPSPDRNGILL
ncbi:hypothetical protein [Chryseobacterium formosense]|uniref:hypothetical protein n=1 Tax=Chryseobacterium formosense TaxID=236814 RepID=UPI0013F3D5B1|nr:hypothetical protein [Chryseobacterium formosense]